MNLARFRGRRQGPRNIQLRARNNISPLSASGVVLGVKFGTNGTLGLVGAVAGDLNVDTRRIVLRTSEGNDLVAEDVLAWCESLGDCRGPRVVGADQLHSCPLPLVILAPLINLDPLKRLFVGISAVAAAVGDVRQHGAFVRGVPRRPVEVHGAAGGHGRGILGRPSAPVADVSGSW